MCMLSCTVLLVPYLTWLNPDYHTEVKLLWPPTDTPLTTPTTTTTSTAAKTQTQTQAKAQPQKQQQPQQNKAKK